MEVRLRIRQTVTRKRRDKMGRLAEYKRWEVHSVPIQRVQALKPVTWRLERDLERMELTLILVGE